MPGPETAHSTNAQDLTTIYWIVVAIAVALAVAVNAAIVLLALRYRAARGREPRRVRGGARIQIRAGAALGLLAAGVFVVGVIYAESARDVDASPGAYQAEPLQIRAVGQQWIWRYEYPPADAKPSDSVEGVATPRTPGGITPGGGEFASVFSYYELVVPVDTTVKLSVASTDVVHRWSVPALAPSVETVPGHLNTVWFRADETGTFDGASTAFSGPSYATMRTRVRVVTPEQYKVWLTGQANKIAHSQAIVQRAVRAHAASELGGGE